MNDPSRRRIRLGRRSRHRRRRLLRRIAFGAILFAGFVLTSLTYFPQTLSFLHRTSAQPVTAWEVGNPREGLALLAAQQAPKHHWVRKVRPVYPYSVIPGGVQDPDDLRLAAAEDRAVKDHFSLFRWERARIIQLHKAAMMHVSFRLGNQIFWTKKKIRIPAGEKLITDGKIMARTRCGNRVEEMAQPAITDQEPAAEKFEQPMMADGSAMHGPIPTNFESSLRGPEGPPLMAQGPPALSPLPGNVLFPIGPPVDVCGLKKDEDKKKCRPKPPPPAIPEPSTLVLLTSGLTGVYLRYRRKAAKA